MTAKDAGAGPDLMIKSEEILSVALRGGPLSNFCELCRLAFEESDLTSEDIKKPWIMLRRMLDTAHLPLFNASGAMSAKFDCLRDAVRGAVVSGSSSQKAENLQPLLELMEDVDRMRTEGLGTEGNDIGARPYPPYRSGRTEGAHPGTKHTF